jgi:hypothetical protein
MEEFIRYLTNRVESCRNEIDDLEKNGCRDEADFAKVRMNIYEVCKTVTNALMNRPGAGASAVRAQFNRFRTEWSAALDRAKSNDDIRNVVIGETKLEVLNDVISRFPEVIK